MAYTSNVTKMSVERLTPSDFEVTISVVINDGVSDVMEKNYSTRYYKETTIGDIRIALQDKIKADWNKYIAEKTIYDAAAFDTMVGQIQSAIDVYIN